MLTPPTNQRISFIPCRADKRPLGPWKDNMQRIIPPPPADAYGVVCGPVSGNLECIDYDRKADRNADITWDAFQELVEATAPFLWQRLVIQSTQNGGYHIIYRCPGTIIPGNAKLAQPDGQLEAIFETRGTGGYFITAPSPGYAFVQNSLDNIPDITPDERELLITIARTFGSTPDVEPDTIIADRAHASAVNGYAGGLSPLDDYDQRGDVLHLLTHVHGWRIAYNRDGTTYLTRPGKTHGVSATFNYRGSRRLFVFTTSTQFQAGRSYKPSSIYGLLEHAGNFHNAARQLASEGFGRRPTQAPTTATGEELTDDAIISYAWQGQYGDALLLARLLGPQAVFDAAVQSWYLFDTPDAPGHWHIDNGGRILNTAIEHLVGVYSQAYEHVREQEEQAEDEFLQTANSDRNTSNRARKQANRASTLSEMLNKRIQSLRTTRYVKAVLELTRGHLTISGTQWDRDPMILGVPNGVVDLRTGKLRPAEPSDYIRRIAATRYNPDATAPRFQQFLSEVLDDDHMASYVRRLLGYGITGLTTEHIYPILWGADGRNGKDTLLDILFRTLGTQIAKPVSPDTVIVSGKRNVGAATPELFDLYGARIVWINETEESDRIRASQLKALSGGSIIKCRPLHGNLIEFAPTHLMLLVTNYKPSVPSHDNALWERIHLIPFTQRFIANPRKPNERPVDKTLPQKLAEEREGILTYLVKGCLEWQSVGLQPPTTITDSTKEYRRESDTFKDWLEEECEIHPGVAIRNSVAYNSYRRWCDDNGFYVGGPRTFFIRLEQEGFVKIRETMGIKGRGYQGLTLKTTHVERFPPT